MKSLLPYFIEIFENGTMVLKEYLNDCAVEKSNQRPIIIIIHDESTFSANNRRRKVWTLNSQNILRSKKIIKGIIVLDFLLL